MSTASLDADIFRLLGDEVRLRMLRLLARERLNVGELVRIVGLAQSTVSRHVKRLRDGGLVRERREAGWTWLELEATAPDGVGACWAGLRASFDDAPDRHGDDARLAEILREREERRVGWGAGGREPAEPGRSWAAWARALGHVMPPLRVVDLGCGEGRLTLEIAAWAKAVTAVDENAETLRRARAAGKAAGAANIRYRNAPLDALPLQDEAFELALLSQVLHRVEHPAAVVREAARIVEPGGRLLVLELLPHDEDWVRDRLGHRRLGIPTGEVRAWLSDAGLEDVRLDEVARRRGNPFVVYAASAAKPKGASR